MAESDTEHPYVEHRPVGTTNGTTQDTRSQHHWQVALLATLAGYLDPDDLRDWALLMRRAILRTRGDPCTWDTATGQGHLGPLCAQMCRRQCFFVGEFHLE